MSESKMKRCGIDNVEHLKNINIKISILLKMRYILMLVMVAMSVEMVAQIASPTASAKQKVANDSVYLFSSLQNALLTATSREKATITWYSFSEDSHLFDKIIFTNNDTLESTLNVENEGGYAATIVTAKDTVQYRAWCFVPRLDSVTLFIDSVDCEQTIVSAALQQKIDSIYNVKTAHYERVNNEIKYNWYTCDTLNSFTTRPQAWLDSPLEDGYVKVAVSNAIGQQLADSAFQEAVGVKASFTTSIREHDIPNEITSPTNYSAPVEIEFTNTSRGEYSVSEWAMGNVARIYETNPVYMFQKSGEYTVKLIVTNEHSPLGCQSSDSTFTISVTDANIGFPDAFTPNGDGVNDLFLPAYKSIKSYKISIMNRWGKEVYSSTSLSEGWNGKVNGHEAPTGTYFYIVDAEAYDKNVTFHKRGSVTLLR